MFTHLYCVNYYYEDFIKYSHWLLTLNKILFQFILFLLDYHNIRMQISYLSYLRYALSI